MTVFVDSSFYVATIVGRDQYAHAARKAAREKANHVTSSLVISETIGYLQKRGFLSPALQFLLEAQRGTLAQVVHVDPLLHAEGWRLFHKYAGAGASPVDCVSFAVMNRLSIKRAYTFDKHFTGAGFQILEA